MAEVITKVLYPGGQPPGGQIPAAVASSISWYPPPCRTLSSAICEQYDSLDNLPDKAAIHINDTHPTLAIPELMRILLDECGYGWDARLGYRRPHVCAYTNHTVMAEALECWPEDLFRSRLPRIYQIVREINRRFCDADDGGKPDGDRDKVGRMAIIS